LPSANDTRTFVSPRTIPVPTEFSFVDREELWTLSEASGICSRGSVALDPKFVMRVFEQNGKYMKRVHYGRSLKRFDKFVANFDPSDETMVFKYNKC
tara:strand:- start:14048 stop:14338 length:291 start_codon:yes stop_codon:yes gene_type:complete